MNYKNYMYVAGLKRDSRSMNAVNMMVLRRKAG